MLWMSDRLIECKVSNYQQQKSHTNRPVNKEINMYDKSAHILVHPSGGVIVGGWPVKFRPDHSIRLYRAIFKVFLLAVVWVLGAIIMFWTVIIRLCGKTREPWHWVSCSVSCGRLSGVIVTVNNRGWGRGGGGHWSVYNCNTLTDKDMQFPSYCCT